MNNLFNFGNKQRLHTQLIGNTTGKELFKVNEYNERKKRTGVLSVSLIILFTIFYFYIQNIPTKILIFMIIITLGLCFWLYSNFKQQRILRGVLYDN